MCEIFSILSFLSPFVPLESVRGTGKFRSLAVLNVTLCKSNRLAEIYLHGVIIWWYRLFDHTKDDRPPSRFLPLPYLGAKGNAIR